MDTLTVYQKYQKSFVYLARKYSFNQEEYEDLISLFTLKTVENPEKISCKKLACLAIDYVRHKLLTKLPVVDTPIEEHTHASKAFVEENPSIVGKLFDYLSEDARAVALLILDPDFEFAATISKEQPKLVKKSLINWLRSKGWKKSRIMDSFIELRNALQT